MKRLLSYNAKSLGYSPNFLSVYKSISQINPISLFLQVVKLSD